MAVGSGTMHAVVFDTFGAPSVLRIAERPRPTPRAGEVLVRVAASTVNPTDLLMRCGAQAAMMVGLMPPFTGGMEFSGHVCGVGEGVDFADGTPVIGVVNPRRPAGGAHATHVVVPVASIAALDRGVDLVGTATVPMNALTAALALEIVALPQGGSLLVTGGAGMLGGSVLQLARQAGLRVLANCAPADASLLRELGADVVLPRDEGLAEAVAAAAPGGVDALIDGALIGAAASRFVKPGGAAVSLRKSHPIGDERLRCGYVSIIDGLARTDIITAIAADIGRGTLRARTAEDGKFPYQSAEDAHLAAERNRARGRIVLTFAD